MLVTEVRQGDAASSCYAVYSPTGAKASATPKGTDYKEKLRVLEADKPPDFWLCAGTREEWQRAFEKWGDWSKKYDALNKQWQQNCENWRQMGTHPARRNTKAALLGVVTLCVFSNSSSSSDTRAAATHRALRPQVDYLPVARRDAREAAARRLALRRQVADPPVARRGTRAAVARSLARRRQAADLRRARRDTKVAAARRLAPRRQVEDLRLPRIGLRRRVAEAAIPARGLLSRHWAMMLALCAM